MEKGRTKNAVRNTFFGFIMKMLQILLPFIVRAVMIRTLGMQYLGLSSLFTSILSVLNLAELGIGSAMVFSMYEPVAKHDDTRVCALLNLYKLYYRVIGLVVGVVGVALIPFLPKLIKNGTPEDVSLTVLYLLNLSATVLSYWLLAYRGSILQANQREDVASKIRIVMTIIQNTLQILALYMVGNYYYFVMITLLIQICTNITIAYFATKLFPQYRPEGKLDKEEIQVINDKIKDLFTSKLGSVVFSSVDSMVISAFLGLEMVGIYQNYYYVVNSLIGILQVVYAACMAGIGNSIIVESQEKNFKDLRKLTFIIAWVAGLSTCFLVVLYQPFMQLIDWPLLPFRFVICISAFFFIWELYRLINVYKDAAGMWHEDRFRPLAAAIVNLTLNIILVQIIGLYGVILSTVLSVLFVGTPWLLHNLFTNLFEFKFCKVYLRKLGFYTVVTILAVSVNYFICNRITLGGILGFVLKGIVCCIIPNLIFLLIYYRTEEFRDFLKLLDSISGYRFNIEKKVLR